MAKVFVQFTDKNKTDVIATFGCAQDVSVYPNQAQIDDSDARLVAFNARVAGQDIQSQALRALSASDSVILHCFETGAAVPAVWVTYRAALRDVLKGTSATLPSAPDSVA